MNDEIPIQYAERNVDGEYVDHYRLLIRDRYALLADYGDFAVVAMITRDGGLECHVTHHKCKRNGSPVMMAQRVLEHFAEHDWIIPLYRCADCKNWTMNKPFCNRCLEQRLEGERNYIPLRERESLTHSCDEVV
jgi:hypothetical protein